MIAAARLACPRISKLLLISLRLISASLGVLVLLLMARVLVIVTLGDDSCGGTMVKVFIWKG